MKRLTIVFVGLLVVVGSVAYGATSKPVQSAICVEAETGLVLSESNSDIARPPASMIKMMVMLTTAEGIDDGRWTEDKVITVTRHAQQMGGSQVYLEAGDAYPLGTLMRAIAIASANDAAMAVAEGLWGDEASYLVAANKRAAELGMTHTTIRSPHGLPPARGELSDMTTARDMSALARACVLNKTLMSWVGEKQFVFEEGGAIRKSTNKMLWNVPGCDGLKTGYTRAAGFCISATAERDGIRLVTVVMGHPSSRERFSTATKVMEAGFKEVRRIQVICKGDIIGLPLPVEGGDAPRVRLQATDDVWAVVKDEDADRIEVVTENIHTPLQAPIQKGDAMGVAKVVVNGQLLATTDLCANRDLQRLTLGQRVKRWFGGDL